MKKKLEAIFTIIVSAIIFAFVFKFAYYFVHKIFFEQSPDYISDGVGAFMGAFFAFLFLRLADGLTKIYERKIKHYNALVELDFVLNKNRQEIANNLFIIKQTRTNLAESRRINSIVENPQGLRDISTREELLLKLFGKDIINAVFSYFVGVETINKDLQTTEKFYRNIIDKSLTHNNPSVYINNITELEKHFGVLQKFLNDLMKKTNNVLARVRIDLRRKTLFTKVLSFVMRGHGKASEIEIAKEEKIIEAQVEEIRKESQEENERILNS